MDFAWTVLGSQLFWYYMESQLLWNIYERNNAVAVWIKEGGEVTTANSSCNAIISSSYIQKVLQAVTKFSFSFHMVREPFNVYGPREVLQDANFTKRISPGEIECLSDQRTRAEVSIMTISAR